MMDYSSTLPYESDAVTGVKFEVFKPSTARNIEFNRLNAAFREEARTLRTQIEKNERAIEEHGRNWVRSNEDRYRRAKLTPEAEESKAIITGYENAREIERLRTEIAAMDLQALSTLPEDDPKVEAVNEILKKIETLSETATLYPEPSDLIEERNYLRRSSAILMEEKYRPNRMRWGIKSISGMTINGQPITVENLLSDGPPDLASEVFERVEEVSRFSADKLKKSLPVTTSSDPVAGSEKSTTATTANTANSTPAATAESISLS